MTLLAVERIKLFSTRSSWWCALIALAITIGLAGLVFATAGQGFDATVATTQIGYNFGLMVIMVLAVLAVTTEYRFGTIRTTFQAVPNRTAVLLSKAALVGLVAGVVGLITAFGSWGLARLLRPEAALAIETEQQWRNVAGMGLIYLIGAVVAVAVGVLIRHTAGAVALTLIYVLLVESLVQIIPNIGDDLARWAPFNVGKNFLTAGDPRAYGALQIPNGIPLGAWGSLAYFAGFAAVVLGIAVFVANRRDA